MYDRPTVSQTSMRARPSVSQLFACFLGDAPATLKCAARLARSLEEQFMVDGWPPGRIYGTEIELSRRHAVGRVVVREALRILEARGTARTRCGRNGEAHKRKFRAGDLFFGQTAKCVSPGLPRILDFAQVSGMEIDEDKKIKKLTIDNMLKYSPSHHVERIPREDQLQRRRCSGIRSK